VRAGGPRAGGPRAGGPRAGWQGRSATDAGARFRVISIPLGGEVDDLTAGGSFEWAYVRDTGVLARVDQRTGGLRRFALRALRGMPVVLAASKGAVWLANQHSTHPNLVRVDAASGKIVARPLVPGRSGPVRGLIFAYGSLWILVPDAAFPPGWRVLRLDPSTNRVDKVSADIAGTQFTGHTASIWADAGRIWVTGSQDTIVSLDPRTMAVRSTTIASLSEGLVLGGRSAWRLSSRGPSLAMIDPNTGRVIRAFAVPPPSATGDDDVLAGPALLWVFRGSHLSVFSRSPWRLAASGRVAPLAGESGQPPAVPGRTLWYLAQSSTGTSLDRVDLTR